MYSLTFISNLLNRTDLLYGAWEFTMSSNTENVTFNICLCYLVLVYFIEVPIPSQESERSCICVLGYRFYFFLRFWYLILELFWQSGIVLLYPRSTRGGYTVLPLSIPPSVYPSIPRYLSSHFSQQLLMAEI